MTRNSKAFSLISILIVSCILLQLSVTLRVFRVASEATQLTFLRRFDAPYFWPFLTYGMYRDAHYPGDSISRARVFATLEDGTEVRVVAEDLNMHHWFFTKNFLYDLKLKDHERIREYVSLYEKNKRVRLVELRLENHPVIVTRDGAELADPRVICTLSFPSPKEPGL